VGTKESRSYVNVPNLQTGQEVEKRRGVKIIRRTEESL
jgi:hypothetical protein